MGESFGARMRQRREEQGIALVTIAEQTKIKLSLLEGLERDDVSHWPPGIFRRAYIRAYAHAIGLNPDVVVGEFLEVHSEPSELVAAALANAVAADAAPAHAGPPTRLRYIVGSAIGSFSRLRRGPAGTAEELLPDSRRLRVRSVSEPDVPLETHPSPEPDLPLDADQPPQPAHDHMTTEVDVDSAPANAPVPCDPDWLAVADLCTEIGRVHSRTDLQQLLQEAARILDAPGLVVWVWDAAAEGLRPAVAHGYSDSVLAQIPPVRPDADNATAAAFRSARTCAIKGSQNANGALVVPFLTPEGCAGVLALELQHGGEEAASVRAVATIFAALLARMVDSSQAAEGRPEPDTTVPAVRNFPPPVVHERRRR